MLTKNQQIVIGFQKKSISRQKTLSFLSKDILNTPGYYGYHEIDIKHDYFAYIAGRLDKILARYTPIEGAEFETWFSLVLKRNFYTFIRNMNNRNNKDTIVFTTVANENQIYMEKDYEPEEAALIVMKEQLKSILTASEFEIVSYKTGIDPECNDFETISEMINRKRIIKIQMEDKLGALHTNIMNYRKKIDSAGVDESKEIYLNKLRKLIEIKRNLEKKIDKVKIATTNRWIAARLNIDEGTVGAYLYKIRNKIKTHIKLYDF